MKIPEIDFSELEIREIGIWPLILRVVVIVAACIATLTLSFVFIWRSQFNVLVDQNKQIADKLNEFKDKYSKAVHLDAYEKQSITVQHAYKTLFSELPTSDQIPELLDNVSREAENNGLQYQSIHPGETTSEMGFYKSMPIDMDLSGTYKGFGGFVSDLAKIPRIVTLHDFTIKPSSAKDGSGGPLDMIIQAKTYWLFMEKTPAATPTMGKPPLNKAPPGAVQKITPIQPGIKGPGASMPSRPGLPPPVTGGGQ